MGWIVSMCLLVVGTMSGNAEILIAAGLFAIAGDIGFAANKK